MANDPLSAAQGLRDLIIESRDETESKRQLAAPIVEALVDSKLCRARTMRFSIRGTWAVCEARAVMMRSSRTR